MNKHTIKNIVFDIGNVLLKINPRFPLEPLMTPLDNNIRLLEHLNTQYQIFAITDASLQEVAYESTQFDFFSKFKDIITAEECNITKNNPAIYQYFLKKHHLIPEECVFIDDRPDNISAAKENSLHVICFTSLDNCINELTALGVNAMRSQDNDL